MSVENNSTKYLLKDGKQAIDYLFKGGFGLGYCIGRAALCRFKAGLETDKEKQDFLMKACNWHIDKLASKSNFVREEIVEIVKSLVAQIEADKIVQTDSIGERV
ncbi:MAG: hypothetical protein J6Q22_10375 [Prevotella sp.]|nr:hypothetical protein [Prevotella sp.]